MSRFIDVPQDDCHEHGSDIGGEAHADKGPNAPGNDGSNGHADEDCRHVLDDGETVQFLACGGVDVFNACILEIFRHIRCQMMALNENAGQGTAYKDGGDEPKVAAAIPTSRPAG